MEHIYEISLLHIADNQLGNFWYNNSHVYMMS